MSSELMKHRLRGLSDVFFDYYLASDVDEKMVVINQALTDSERIEVGLRERIQLLNAQVKNRDLQIVKLESAERIRKAEEDIRSDGVCSHYRPDCPEHREQL